MKSLMVSGDLPQIHRVLQWIAIGFAENQSIAIVPDSPDGPRRAAL
jgi:hypothetical protein